MTGSLALGDDVVEPNPPTMQLFATGLAGHTAICCDGNGNMLATNYRYLGSVGKINPQSGAEVLFDAPKVAADENQEPEPLVGIAIDADQRILALESNHGRLLRWSPTAGTVSILADRYQGHRFDSLFAVDVGPGGNIYFSEPERANADSPSGSLYRFDVATNRPTLLVGGLTQPTGICVTSSGKSLFVAEAGLAQITRFDLNEDGEAEKVAAYSLSMLLELDDPKELGRIAHVALDRRAWLYVALWDRGEVAVIDTNSGKLLELIPCGSETVFGLALWQDALLISIPGKEAIYRYDLRPLIGRHAP